MTILVFDIETIPDVETARKLYDLNGLSDADTASALFALRRAKVGHDFLPHYLQKIINMIYISHLQEKLDILNGIFHMILGYLYKSM